MAAAPIVVFGRWLITAAAAVYANWDTITALFDRVEIDSSHPIYGYRYVAVIGQRDAVSGAWTQRAQYSIAYVNVTSGDPDFTWTTGDYTAIETASEAFWTALAARIPTSYRLEEHRWYAYGPGVTPPNPVTRYVTLATPIAGTSTGATHMSAAMAVTLKTTLRKHWGRFYVPVSVQGFPFDAAGRASSSNVDTFASAARTFLTAGSAAGVLPAVWDDAHKVVHGMTAIQVDDIPDVIRRRRQSVTQYRKTYVS